MPCISLQSPGARLLRSSGKDRSVEGGEEGKKGRKHGCQMAIAKFLDCRCLALPALRTWIPWITPPALHPDAIQGKEGIKFCHLATLGSSPPTTFHRAFPPFGLFRFVFPLFTSRRPAVGTCLDSLSRLTRQQLSGGRRQRNCYSPLSPLPLSL